EVRRCGCRSGGGNAPCAKTSTIDQGSLSRTSHRRFDRRIGYTRGRVTDETGRSQYGDESTTLGLAADLRRAMLVFLRILRAGRGSLNLKRAMPLVEEMDALLTAVLAMYGEVHLRVG